MIKKSFLFLTLCLLGIVVSVLFLYKKCTRKAVMQGQIILLDGTSSAGKSTLAKNLQQKINCEYLFIDNFLFNETATWVEQQVFLKEGRQVKLPRNNTDAIRHYYDTMPNKDQYIITVDVFKDCVKKANESMAHETKKLALLGKTVICDVVFAPGYVEERDFTDDLKEFKKWAVLIYCPFKTLAQRVEKRNKEAKEGKAGEVRSLVMALEQFGMKYKKRENQNEQVIDQLTRKDFNDAVTIAKQDFTKFEQNILEEKYAAWVNILKKQLGFDDEKIESIEITPRTRCDFIVNTEIYSVEECAQLIKRNIIINDWLIKKRLKHEPPAAIAERGWRYHHLGIPCTEPRSGETHYAHLKIYVSGFETSPYGIEWMRFEKDCPVPDVVRKVPHVAFEVDDLDEALKGKEILLEPGTPSGGCRAAMIMHDGAPVELIEFKKEQGRY